MEAEFYLCFLKEKLAVGGEREEEEGRRDEGREDLFVVFSIFPPSPFLISRHTNKSFPPNRKEEKDGEVFMDI